MALPTLSARSTAPVSPCTTSTHTAPGSAVGEMAGGVASDVAYVALTSNGAAVARRNPGSRHIVCSNGPPKRLPWKSGSTLVISPASRPPTKTGAPDTPFQRTASASSSTPTCSSLPFSLRPPRWYSVPFRPTVVQVGRASCSVSPATGKPQDCQAWSAAMSSVSQSTSARPAIG